MSAAGPYDRWPLGRGFERYDGYLGGDTNQYYPELVSDNRTVEPEKSPEEGYILIEDLTDKAISFIADSKQVAPNKPFFLESLARARDTRLITCPRSGRTSTRESLTMAGTHIGQRRSRGRKSWALSRKMLSSRATIPMWRSCKNALGGRGLNYLCVGYKAFFKHIDRPMKLIMDLLLRGREALYGLGQWLDAGTLFQAYRETSTQRGEVPQHQGRRGLPGL